MKKFDKISAVNGKRGSANEMRRSPDVYFSPSSHPFEFRVQSIERDGFIKINLHQFDKGIALQAFFFFLLEVLLEDDGLGHCGRNLGFAAALSATAHRDSATGNLVSYDAWKNLGMACGPKPLTVTGCHRLEEAGNHWKSLKRSPKMILIGFCRFPVGQPWTFCSGLASMN